MGGLWTCWQISRPEAGGPRRAECRSATAANPSKLQGSAVALAIAFLSATQDIVVDAWRIEAADASHQGAMAAAYQWGYRLAVVVAGAAPLLLAETYGWGLSYSAMAALMGVGVLAVLFAPKETDKDERDATAQPAQADASEHSFLYRAFVEPLQPPSGLALAPLG